MPKFVLVDYLFHLVNDHGIEETKQLRESGLERLEMLHAAAHAREDVILVEAEIITAEEAAQRAAFKEKLQSIGYTKSIQWRRGKQKTKGFGPVTH
jgi:uncharacterized membrane protein